MFVRLLMRAWIGGDGGNIRSQILSKTRMFNRRPLKKNQRVIVEIDLDSLKIRLRRAACRWLVVVLLGGPGSGYAHAFVLTLFVFKSIAPSAQRTFG